MGKYPVMTAQVKNRNSHFISTELELGLSRAGTVKNDFLGVNVLAHPFSEFTYQPHFLVGLGYMVSDFPVANVIESEGGMYFKAGLGLTKNLSQRLRFRADLSQYAVDNNIEAYNHYSQITIGSAYLWGSSTDEIFNRSIGEKVSVTDLEISLLNGSINLNNIDSISISGLRASYHISEDHFFEASYSIGSKD